MNHQTRRRPTSVSGGAVRRPPPQVGGAVSDGHLGPAAAVDTSQPRYFWPTRRARTCPGRPARSAAEAGPAATVPAASKERRAAARPAGDVTGPQVRAGLSARHSPDPETGRGTGRSGAAAAGRDAPSRDAPTERRAGGRRSGIRKATDGASPQNGGRSLLHSAPPRRVGGRQCSLFVGAHFDGSSA